MANVDEILPGRVTLEAACVDRPYLKPETLIDTRLARHPGEEDHVTTTWKGPCPSVLGASTLAGNSVRNLAGETLGTIEEFMIGLETGKVAYCDLSCENRPGTGEKLFAIPFGAMTLDPRDHAFTRDIARERLVGAPGFDRAAWSDVTGRSWEERVLGLYDVRPCWM